MRAVSSCLRKDSWLPSVSPCASRAGARAFWLPVYVRLLDTEYESPLFPAFGRSSVRGLFIKWNLPFFLTESLYGAFLIDYFSRHDEVGLGLLAHYRLLESEGRITAYGLPSDVESSHFTFELEHQLAIGRDWEGRAEVDFERVDEKQELSFSARLERGTEDGGSRSPPFERRPSTPTARPRRNASRRSS
jgi:hypothetical protein